METRGKTVIIAIFAVAIAATVFAWAFRKQQSQRLLEVWGGEVASRVRLAKSVFYLELERGESSPDEGLTIEDTAYTVSARIETTKQPGMINAQAAIISDASFDWQRKPQHPEWTSAFEFRDAQANMTIIAFDLPGKAAICLEKKHTIGIGEKLADGLTEFVAEITKGVERD